VSLARHNYTNNEKRNKAPQFAGMLSATIFQLLGTSLLSYGLSIDALGPLEVHFALDTPPLGFQLLKSTSNTLLDTNKATNNQNNLNLRIGLASSNVAGLEQALNDISTPGNSRYQDFLSEEEVAQYIEPSQEAKDALKTWLSAHNLTASPITPAGEWVEITNLPVSKANSLLNADFTMFVHPASGETAMRTLSYSIPSALKVHIDTVYPGASFDFGLGKIVQTAPLTTPSSSRMIKKRKGGKRRSDDSTVSLATRSGPPASCATLATPTCLQQLYDIPSTPATQESNTLTVTGYDGQFAQKADLQMFLSLLRPDISPNTTFGLQTLDKGQNVQAPSQAGNEANLDIQLTIGLATGVPVNFLSVGEVDTFDGLGAFIDTANFVLRQGRSRPSVLTTSYGFNEPDLDPTTMRKLCTSYLQLGALGTSVIFSSGDGGVSGNGFTDCPDKGKFVSSFPSSCPYVTSVGGTSADGDAFPKETALFFGSGGFSNVFKRPWYQLGAVGSYLRVLGSNNTGLYNRQGRGFPDVAAFGANVPIVSGGQRVRAGGTSTSAPIFASVIALLNDQLKARGRRPLGFLNPWLYGVARNGLRDVTSGNNPGCNTTGFFAISGWDPVTGLGTPIFGNLLQAAEFPF